MPQTKIASQQEPIDLIAWRHYGKTTRRVEAVLEDPGNYGLADLTEVLPIGTKVVLPEVVEANVVRTVKLWG